MSTEDNKALVRQLVEQVFGQGNISQVDELVAPDFLEREALPAGIPGGREGLKQLTATLRSAFPDFKARIDDILADGDKVVVRQTWTGTHKGEFMGIPPTGRNISVEVIDIIRLADGKFVEHWGVMDAMAMMQQLGAVPPPGQTGS
jgi:steroid delta-isomerase-like uncharacterized protein